VRFAANAPFFVTHTIEPDVDGARNYLVQDLLDSEYLRALAWAKGLALRRYKERIAGGVPMGRAAWSPGLGWPVIKTPVASLDAAFVGRFSWAGSSR